MIPSKQLEDAYRKVYGSPIVRGENTLGCSEVGFCMEKIVLKMRLKQENAVNGNMVIGKLFHGDLKKILKETVYSKYPKWKIWLKPKFESLAKYSDSRGFNIEGHCDIDLPAFDRVIEAKTTGAQKAWVIGEDFLTDAYVYQANAYAYIKGRKYWELWIVYKEFEDIQNNRFVSVLEGETSKPLFDMFLDRVDNIFKALQVNKDLMGPEQNWECKGCSYVRKCPYWVDLIPRFEKALPNTKALLVVEESMKKAFDLYYDKKWITYDRSAKVYRLRTEADSVEVKE